MTPLPPVTGSCTSGGHDDHSLRHAAAYSHRCCQPTRDPDKVLHLLGIHGDPVAAKRRIEKATREGVRLGADA